MPRVTVAFRHAVKFFPSCSGSFVRTKFRSMGIGMKRFVISTAICRDCAADGSGGHCTACEPWLKRGRSVPNHLSKRRSTPRIKQRQRRKRRSSLNSGLRALRAVHHIDSAARAAGRHRHRSACELRTSSSPVSQCAAHCSCSWSHICQRSSAIRHDSVTFQILTKSE